MRPKLPSLLRAIARWVWVPIVAFVVVVAVAMGCAVWSPFHDWEDPFGRVGSKNIKTPRALRQYDSDLMSGLQERVLGRTLYIVLSGAPIAREGQPEVQSLGVYVLRSGFPFRCMRWTLALNGGMDDWSPFIVGIETALPIDTHGYVRRIPLMPEAIGMVLNVLTYSAAIVLVRYARRWSVVNRRKRKGLCLKCGYPIEPAVATCPECGSAYAPKADPAPS